MLLFLSALTLMGTGTATATALYLSYRLEMKAKEAKIAAIDQSGYSIAEFYVAQAAKGTMTTAQAQAEAAKAFGALRYDGSNYIFVYSEDGTVIVHTHKAGIGTNRLHSAGITGKQCVPGMIRHGVADGHVFTHYYMSRISGGKPIPKISTMKLVPEWGWLIGTGPYVDDIHARLMHSAAIFTPLLCLFLLFVFATRRQVASLLSNLSQSMRNLANGQRPAHLQGRTDRQAAA